MAYDLLGLRSSVKTRIKDSAYSSSTVDEYINDALLEVAALYPWKYLQKVITGLLTPDEYTFELQDDHDYTTQLILIHPTNTDSYWNMTKRFLPYQKFYERYPAPDTNGSAQPYQWTEYGDQRYFNCPVDLAYTLRSYYQKVPTELTADTDIPEFPRMFREAIVLGASYRAEEERENYDIAAITQNRFNDKVGDLIMRHTNTTGIGPDTVILGPRDTDPWSS